MAKLTKKLRDDCARALRFPGMLSTIMMFELADALAACDVEEAAVESDCCIPSPGEPSFTLLGRDPLAPMLVDMWASLREHLVGNPSKVARARAVSVAMRQWLKDGKLAALDEEVSRG